MAQPDIVIGSNRTTVVETVRIGSSRTASPDIELRPGNAGEATLYTQGGNSGIDLSASDGNGASTATVEHPSGPSVDVSAGEATTGTWSTESTVELEGSRKGLGGNGITLFTGNRAGTRVAGLEMGGGQTDPSMLFDNVSSPQEIRVHPQLTAGIQNEGQLFQPGKIATLGGPSEQRRVTVELDGGTSGDGGVVSVRDEEETTNVQLRGQQGNVRVGGGSAAGDIEIMGDPNRNSVTTISMEGQPTGAPGGRIAMQDTSRKTNVELRGDEGLLALGSSTQNAQSAGTHGTITLDDGTGDTLEIRAEDGTITLETDSEGPVFQIETSPSGGGQKEIRTKYPVNEGSL
jgi:hypothetical protein